MSEDTMLVRLPGGDVVRRKIDRIETMEISHPAFDTNIYEVRKQPVLNDGEEMFRAMGDPIPMIIKTR